VLKPDCIARATRVFLFAGLGTCLALTPVFGGPRDVEGALQNDSFLPVNLTADELYRAALQELDAGRRDSGLETLRSALAASATGDSLPLDSDSAPLESGGRLTLGVESAVWRTLMRRAPAEARAWCARFADLAAETAAKDPAGAERRFPGTPAAVKAALGLADRHLADGQVTLAGRFLDRASQHLELRAHAGLDAEAFQTAAQSALGTRRAALEPAAYGPRATTRLSARFDALTTLPRPATIPFEFQIPEEDPYLADLLGRQNQNPTLRGPGLGIRPGLAALGSGRVAVHTGLGLHIIDLAQKRRLAIIEPRRLADQALGQIATPRAARQGGAPGWAHLPVLTDELLLIVTGRTDSGRTPNALMALERDTLVPATFAIDGANLEPHVSRARWMISSNGHLLGDRFTNPDALKVLDGAEIQPGFVVVDDRVILQARVLDGEVQSYLVALDIATGAPLWTRLITKGGSIDDGMRFGQARLPIGSAAPLVVAEGAVLVSTNLGVDALVDPADGRILWSYKTRRADPDDERFSGITPLVQAGAEAFVVTAPADSDHAYVYRPTTLGPAADAPLWCPPLAIDSATDLVGHSERELFFLNQAGGERQLTSRRIQPGAADEPGAQSILLRRDETFVAAPALGDQRLVISSNRGVFLFDRARSLYLADYLSLPGGAGPREAGGAVFGLGEQLLVLGPGTLWVFEPKP
jgi:hypothetical protein